MTAQSRAETCSQRNLINLCCVLTVFLHLIELTIRFMLLPDQIQVVGQNPRLLLLTAVAYFHAERSKSDTIPAAHRFVIYNNWQTFLSHTIHGLLVRFSHHIT